MNSQDSRYHAIDNLRGTMILIVMFGHAVLPYITIPRSFKDPMAHAFFDVAAIFLYSFAMPAFFVTAGFATALLRERKGTRGLARHRFRRVFLPLLIAYIVLSPLTRGAYTFAKQTALSGSLQAGFDAFLLGDWIRWGKTYHLWFLVSLLLFSAIAIGLRSLVLWLAGDRAERLLRGSRALLASRWRASLLALFSAACMIPAYVLSGTDATTLPMQVALLGFFLFGWLLHVHRDLLPTMRLRPWWLISVAVAAMPLAVWSTREVLLAPHDPQLAAGILAGISNSVLAAFMTLGVLGVYLARFNQASARGRYISDASYWIYLIHLPLLVAASGVLTVTPFHAVIKYLLSLAMVVPIVWLTYHFGVRRYRTVA
jgi:glucan biosynthesis protein C